MGKWGKWEICPKLSHFYPIFLQFPMNSTHSFYMSHWVFLALSHISSIFPRCPPFPPIFPFSPVFFTSAASQLIQLWLTPTPVRRDPMHTSQYVFRSHTCISYCVDSAQSVDTAHPFTCVQCVDTVHTWTQCLQHAHIVGTVHMS